MSAIAVNIQEAVKISGLSRSALYLLIKEGTIKPRKYGKRTLVLVEDLEHYIKSLPSAA